MTDNFYRKLNFSDVRLYAVTPEPAHTPNLLEKIEKLLAGGVDAVQLRSRQLADRALVALGKEIKQKCHKAGALFIVNNRPEIALATDADGLHLGHEDLPLEFAREMLGHRKIIGMSTHSLPEALSAQKQGADYVSCGPIWSTPTKPGYNAVGLNLIGLYKAAIRIPFVVIGGVNEKNIDQVLAAGGKTVAVVRAFFDSDHPEKLAREFKDKLEDKVWL
ncbi:MAG: Thiamine-phosphate synthase [Elusimicrobia bacterium]|nr:Thiamine-phosphate synthase [Elusimicrobiota bacterium]